MSKKSTIMLPLLACTLLLSACSTATSGAHASAPASTSASSPSATAPSAVADGQPDPKQTPTGVPSTGLYMLVTGEPGVAQVSVIHYVGGKSLADRKDGSNYKEQLTKVKVPGYIKVELANLSQISEHTTKVGQSLGCDFVYNGEFRPKDAPTPADPNQQSLCYETGVASAQ